MSSDWPIDPIMTAHIANGFPDMASRRTKLDDHVKERVGTLPSKPRLESDASSSVTVACPEQTAWTTKETQGDVSHQIISSYFIGPQAENLPYFEQNIHTILEELRLARTRYFPGDGVYLACPSLVHTVYLTGLCRNSSTRRSSRPLPLKSPWTSLVVLSKRRPTSSVAHPSHSGLLVTRPTCAPT
jgi:hypothetical protein